jgi:hypothetical protein
VQAGVHFVTPPRGTLQKYVSLDSLVLARRVSLCSDLSKLILSSSVKLPFKSVCGEWGDAIMQMYSRVRKA